MKQKKMLLLSIANVQKFISASYNAKDLLNSSKIIEETVDRHYKVLKEQLCDFEIMSWKEQEEKIRTNYFLASFSWEQGKQENQQVEEEIRNMLSEEADGGEILYADLPVFIIVEDYDPEKNNYGETYHRIYEKFQAYKTNRLTALTFQAQSKPNIDRGKGRNILCDLCGIRYWEEKEEKEEKVYLCPECKRKRHRKEENQAFSVDDVAGNNQNYYALVKMDIDNLGKYLSKSDCDDLKKWQEECMGRMNTFSKEIDSLFEENKIPIQKGGEANLLIYNGGDDILFFSPLEQILKFTAEIEKKLKNEVDSRLSFSTSITIAHRKTALRRIIELTSEKLDAVKQRFYMDGKGGTALTLVYGSYTVRTVYIKSNHLETAGLLLQGMKEELSSDLIYTMEQEFMRFGETMHYCEGDTIREIIYNEISRLVKRKTKNADWAEKYEGAFMRLYNVFWKEQGSYITQDLKSYFQLLHILEKWASEGKEGSVSSEHAV